jgi:RNA 3'-terminal phosphate cyclase (ATP)
VLPALMLAADPSRVAVEGGTHNPQAPPFDFLERVYFPVLARMGPRVEARLLRHGFYPAGGGRVEAEIAPVARLEQVEFVERGALLRVEARALVAALPGEIAVRELAAAAKILEWGEETLRTVQLPDRLGPGNILMLEAEFEHTRELFSGFGQLGVSAESIADKAARRMRGYLASSAFAGPYLADQLLLPMALAGGGRFTTVKPSQHARTGAAVIERFLPVAIRFEERDEGCWLVEISPVTR